MKDRMMRVAAVTFVLLIGLMTGAGPASADGAVSFAATVDGRALADVDGNAPLVLDPGHDLRISLTVHNATAGPVTVRAARLQGRVLGLAFFTFSAVADRTFAPGESGQLDAVFDVTDLGDQATGLLPAELQLLDRRHGVLAQQQFPVDVQGALTSTYGLFGVVVMLATALLLATAIVRLLTGGLPEARWARAVRFAIVGVGVGMTLTFTLSALRVLLPGAGSWLSFVIAGGLVGLVAGFFTPGPADASEPDPDPAPDGGPVLHEPESAADAVSAPAKLQA